MTSSGPGYWRPVLAARQAGQAERLAKVARNLATVRERFGGVPRSRVAGLRRLAAADGVTTEQFDAVLAGEQVIEDGWGDGIEPLAAGVRRQIRDRLVELRQLRVGNRAATASLWAFLGVPADSPPERIRAAYEIALERNQRRPHDREKTVIADLLAQVRTRLLDGDPAAYTAGLVADAREEIRGRVEEHIVLDGELGPAAFEGLVREILSSGSGLSTAQAKTLLLGVARELGAAVTTGVFLDYVVCAQCCRPEPVDGSRICRYCDTELYTACPSCGRETEAAAVACRSCGRSMRQAREAAEAVFAIRRALDAGRVRYAGELLAAARPVLALLDGAAAREAEELGARVQAALAAADAGWRALVDNREARRADAATDGARWLVSHARDVPGPDGRTPEEVLAELVAHQDVIHRRVAAARELPAPDQENALAAVLATAADSREALAALAALPLEPPRDLTATEQDGGVVLRWRASLSSAAPVSYRVVRLFGDASDPERVVAPEHSLGTTGSTELVDAGVPVGVMVRYEVTAIVGSRRSVPVRTPGLVVMRDVTELRAEQIGDAVKLSWRLDGPVDAVTIERTVDESSPVRLPTRRTRANAGQYVDSAVQAGVTYRYQVYVEFHDADAVPARTDGASTMATVIPRPPAIRDLQVTTAAGRTMLRWNAPAGSEVRIYAVPPNDPQPSSQSGLSSSPPGHPLAVEDTEVDLARIADPARLVGSSDSGHLVDLSAAGELEYVPVTVLAGRAVVGRAVRHLIVGEITELRADDRGEEIVLSFRMPLGITEARVLWRRDQLPTGPDDPEADQAKVTNTSLEIKGGWHLAAPSDGSAYFIACYPLVHIGGTLTAVPPGTGILARPAVRAEQDARPNPPLRVDVSAPAAGGQEGWRAAHPSTHPSTSADPADPAAAGDQQAAGDQRAAEDRQAAGSAGASADPPTGASSLVQPDQQPQQEQPYQGQPRKEQQPQQPQQEQQEQQPQQEHQPQQQQMREDAAMVSYMVARVGWRRRTLRVQVRAEGLLPELLLVARSGTTPPQTREDGQVLARVPAREAAHAHGEHTVEVPLDGARLPWGVRLLPGPDAAQIVLRHPPDDALVLR
ncbi:zinc ribbon domain-containing protein [Protofrankia coriariae]|uniref:zinc ribbon domain-containing protein n=1 Tax=Protofrankia coriariae TaxID=1562887 RepID=UPI0012F68F34